MILSSTLRKLRAEGKQVFRVTIPAHTITINGDSVECREDLQDFVTRAQAEKWASTFESGRPFGCPVDAIKIERISANDAGDFFDNMLAHRANPT